VALPIQPHSAHDGVPSLTKKSIMRTIYAGERFYGRGPLLMSTTQAFLLGVMAAWTPTLVILAWLLRDPMQDVWGSKSDG
jgi:hypothetical protein